MKSAANLLGFAFALAFAGIVAGDDWPQAGANAARTSHVGDEPRGPHKVAWVKRWGDEVLFTSNQPVIAGGVLYVASQNGVVHAVNVETGEDLWAADVGAPIVHALACDGERVYAAAFDGAIHALDRTTGEDAWAAKLSRRGFSAAPLLMDGNVYVGNRDGVFYAVKADTGELLWKTDTGDPIVQTAAGADGRIVFVNDAMRAFCLDAVSGKTLWSAGPLPGGSVRDYWPVIYEGRVIIRTAEAGPRDLTEDINALQKKFFWPVSYQEVKDQQVLFKAASKEDILKEQDVFVDFLRKHPFARSFIVLNFADGTEPYTTSVLQSCRNTGAPTPPVVAGDGNLYTTFLSSGSPRGIINITDCGLGRFNLETGKIDEPLLCGGFRGLHEILGRSPFELTSDETVTLSSGGNLIFGFRSNHNGGAIDVATRKSYRLPQVKLPRAHNMTESGNVLAISGKYVAYTKFNHVICIRGQ